MKQSTIFEFIVGFIVALLIASVVVWHYHNLKHPSDAQVRRMLPGTWVVSWGDNHFHDKFTNIIGADARYAHQLTDPETGSVVANIEGAFQVSDGYLIDTMTKCSRTNVHVPNVYRGQVIRADSREMAFVFVDGGGGAATNYYRKVMP